METAASSASRNWLSRASPALKLGSVLVLVCGIAILPRRPSLWYALPALVVAAAWLLAKMPLAYAARRLLMAQVFITGIAFLWLFSPGAGPLVLSVFLKSNLSILALLVLAWTTPFHQVLQVLRSWRVPGVMLTTLALMCRYLPVLAEESRRMQRARASRTFASSRRFAWANLSQIIARLFVRSIGRAERVYLAMCARGWR